MPVKPPSIGITTAEVHHLPSRPANDTPTHRAPMLHIPPAAHSPVITPTRNSGAANAQLDTINSDPAVVVNELDAPFPATSSRHALEMYRISPGAQLPPADASGFRSFKGRLFVDTHDGAILYIGLDPDSGLYRARLRSELKPSGPILYQDPDTRRWHPLLDDLEGHSVPLSSSRLEPFRTTLDFSAVTPDSDGLHSFEGKRYLVVENHAHQVLRDVDASSAGRRVWRVVNPKDPVATDSENIYRASRSGESLAVTRSAEGIWTASLDGLMGGMRRNPTAQDNKSYLLQRYEPVRNAFDALVASERRYGELWRNARILPEGSDAVKAALIALEVHVIKHTRMQTDYAKSLIENKDWLILLKAGGLYKTELHAQQINRIDYLNKLLAVMDRRVLPTLNVITVESLKHNLAHLNKKLKIMDDRQAVMDLLQKTDRSAVSIMDDMNRALPSVDQINASKYNICLRLISDDPQTPPDQGLRSAMAMHLHKQDLNNVRGYSEPLALQLSIENIKSDRAGLQTLIASTPPARAEFVNQALSLLDAFEVKIEARLNEIYDRFDSNHELPSYDQEIDFDFLPEQTAGATEVVAPRKLFRTRQHGTYQVLVGVPDTAADGSVTLNVANIFKPNDPPQRYKKREGEWQPVRPAATPIPKLQLMDEASARLGNMDAYVAHARQMESRRDNPTSIVEYLGAETDRLTDLAKRLEPTDGTAAGADATGLIRRLKAAAQSMDAEGQSILIRMYKNREVLDVLRLSFLLDHSQLKVVKTLERRQMGKGKGKEKSFLDVYSINDRSDNAPLWEAHFHYDRPDRAALDYSVKGAHLKTLEQRALGRSFQQREEQAGRPHQRIWRELINPRIAQKLFDHLT
jgi:hypothetical protein